MAKRLKNQSGAAVIVVLCMLALFTAMGLSLVLASSSLAAAAQQKYKQEECYQLAKSFAGVLRGELDAAGGDDRRVLSGEALSDDALPAAFYRVSQSLSSTDDGLHATQFLCDDPLGAEQYGSVSLLVRREDYTGDAVSAAASYDCTLYVTVRVEKGGVQYDYETVYLRLRQLEERHITGEGDEAVPVSKNAQNQWVTQEGDIVPSELVRTVYEDTANTAYSFWYQYGG